MAERAIAATTIRLATASDLEAVALLLRACIAGMRSAGIDQWDDVYPDRATLEADVGAANMYLALVDPSTLVGAMVLNDYQNPEYAQVPWTLEADRVAVVHRLMVDPRYEGRGIARGFMAFAECRAHELGYGAIRLDAFTKNSRALRLYESLGYRDAGGVTFRKGPFRCFEKRV